MLCSWEGNSELGRKQWHSAARFLTLDTCELINYSHIVYGTTSDVVLETKVLVSRRLEDKK